ncbi:MAG: TIGR02206 family membrane protein [Akkermansia sp.]|nr:TIGR02206 family membrane protein [Akkermansia sp.]
MLNSAYTEFCIGSSMHLYSLLVVGAVCAVILTWGRFSGSNGKQRICLSIAAANLAAFVFEYIWRFCNHSTEVFVRDKLPLHFCAVMALLCFIALWWKQRWARSLVYFGVLSASIQGLLTPFLSIGFPHLEFFLFFLSHGLLLLAALAIPLLTDWRADRRAPVQSLLLMNAYLVVIHPINLLLGSNYGFTTAAPTGSILEALGTPAPWYYLWLEVPALLLFLFMYLFVRQKKTTA